MLIAFISVLNKYQQSKLKRKRHKRKSEWSNYLTKLFSYFYEVIKKLTFLIFLPPSKNATKISLDGALKYRNSICQYQPNNNGYANPCLQASFDQISTISRPHSADVGVMNHSSSSSMHGRSNGFLSRGASSNLNGLYEDVDFQPTPRTLTKKKNIVWMRPHVSWKFSLLT